MTNGEFEKLKEIYLDETFLASLFRLEKVRSKLSKIWRSVHKEFLYEVVELTFDRCRGIKVTNRGGEGDDLLERFIQEGRIDATADLDERMRRFFTETFLLMVETYYKRRYRAGLYGGKISVALGLPVSSVVDEDMRLVVAVRWLTEQLSKREHPDLQRWWWNLPDKPAEPAETKSAIINLIFNQEAVDLTPEWSSFYIHGARVDNEDQIDELIYPVDDQLIEQFLEDKL